MTEQPTPGINHQIAQMSLHRITHDRVHVVMQGDGSLKNIPLRGAIINTTIRRQGNNEIQQDMDDEPMREFTRRLVRRLVAKHGEPVRGVITLGYEEARPATDWSPATPPRFILSNNIQGVSDTELAQTIKEVIADADARAQATDLLLNRAVHFDNHTAPRCPTVAYRRRDFPQISSY